MTAQFPRLAQDPAGRSIPRILILGGGYVGLYTALRLRRRLKKHQAQIVVVDPRSYMTYQPFLPEAAADSLEPRHVVVSHRRYLKGCEFVTGRVSQVDTGRRTVLVSPEQGEELSIEFDHLVVALGAVARTLPIPGLIDQGIGFKQVEEAMALRNQVLNRIDDAASTWDEDLRRKLLTFVFVGGGFAGVEALGEVEDMAKAALRYNTEISRSDLHFVLVEASPGILPELGEEMGGYAVEQLRKRGIDIRLSTRLESCIDGHIVLSDGGEFDAETLVWTAGVKANPIMASSDLPLAANGQVSCAATLQVVGAQGPVQGIWAAGDCASVPDLTIPGKFCAPTAQHAVRQAKRLGDNIAAVINDSAPKEYSHKNAGTVASLGLGKGVAKIYGIRLKGWLAWFMHRTYHMSAMPTFNRKVRIILDWTLALFFRRDLTAIGSLEKSPRAEFVAAATDTPPRLVE